MDRKIGDVISSVNQALTQGRVFLISREEKDNAMIIGWGGILHIWGKSVFLAPVRLSRYTHGPIANTGYFTVSIPREGELKDAIAHCGTVSGRKSDKFAECGLTAVPGKSVPVPVIGECPLHIECRVLSAQDLDLECLDHAECAQWYGADNTHTLFFGEILACYTTD